MRHLLSGCELGALSPNHDSPELAEASFNQALLVASFTLAVAVTLQTLLMGCYLALSEPGPAQSGATTLASGAVGWVYCHGGLGMLVYSDGALQCGNG